MKYQEQRNQSLGQPVQVVCKVPKAVLASVHVRVRKQSSHSMHGQEKRLLSFINRTNVTS